MEKRDFLVFTSAGENSKHEEWWISDPAHRNFDLMIAYYGDDAGKYRAHSEFYFERKGSKFQNFLAALEKYREEILGYKAVFILDDDIEITTQSISRLFELQQQYGLLLCQPSFTWDSVSQWHILFRRPFSTLRYSNFVECGLALFSREALIKCEPSFGTSISGNGQDHIWVKILGYPRTKIAVIDAVQASHPKRVSEMDRVWPRHAQSEEGRQAMKAYGIDLPLSGESRPRIYSSVLAEVGSFNLVSRRFRRSFSENYGFAFKVCRKLLQLFGR
jgi:hypothetical protein